MSGQKIIEKPPAVPTSKKHACMNIIQGCSPGANQGWQGSGSRAESSLLYERSKNHRKTASRSDLKEQSMHEYRQQLQMQAHQVQIRAGRGQKAGANRAWPKFVNRGSLKKHRKTGRNSPFKESNMHEYHRGMQIEAHQVQIGAGRDQKASLAKNRSIEDRSKNTKKPPAVPTPKNQTCMNIINNCKCKLTRCKSSLPGAKKRKKPGSLINGGKKSI
jgi:hypothetical protein